MISIPKYLVFLYIILLPRVSAAVALKKPSTVRFAEGIKVASKSLGHHHSLSHGQLRPVPSHSENLEERQKYPAFTYPSSAPFIKDLTATSSILTTRTGVHSNEQETGTTSQQVVGSTKNQSSLLFTTVTISNAPSPELSLSSTGSASISTGSGCPQTNNTVTVIVTEIESWSIPQSLGTKPTGPPISLPPCPSHDPLLTPLGCTEFTGSATTHQTTTTYSWSDYNYNSTTSAKAISDTSQGNSYRLRDFTTPHATPCASNTALLCVELTLGAVNAALTSVPTSGSHSQTWKLAEATPCAEDKNFECMNISPAIITIAPSTTSLSSNAAILSDPTSAVSVIPSVLSALLETSVSQISISLGESNGSTPTPTSHSPSLSPASPGPCSFNTSLECIVQGYRTITVGTITQEASSTSKSDSTSFSVLTSSTASSSDSQSTIAMTSTLPPLTSLPTQNNPPQSPSGSVQGSWAFKRFEIPKFMVLLCSLVSAVASLDIRPASYLAGRSNVPMSSVEPDGNYGIGVPSASSTIPAATPPTASFIQPVSASTPSISATPFTTSFVQPDQETSSSFSPFPKSFIVPVTGSAASASSSTTPPPLKATSGSIKLKIPGLLLLFSALIYRAAAAIATPTPPNPFIGPQLCAGQTDFASCGVFTGSTVYLSPTSNPTFGSPHGGFSTVAVTTGVATATIVEPPVAPAVSQKGQTSGSSKAKIPFLLLLLCSLLSLGFATITSPTPPNPFVGPQTCSGQTDFANCAVFSGSTVWLSPISAPTSTSPQEFSTVVTKSTISTSISSEQHGAFTTPPAPSPCASNTNLECIVLGKNTITVGTLAPQTTFMTTPATTTSRVVSSSSTGPAASSKTATSGSSKAKIPSLLFLLCSLVSKAAAITTSLQPIDGFQTPRTYDRHTFLESYGGFDGSTASSSPTPTPTTQSTELPTSNQPGGPSTSSSTTQSISGLLIPHICNGHTFLESCLEFLTSQPAPPPGAPSTVVIIQTAGTASSEQGLPIVPMTAQATAALDVVPSTIFLEPAPSKTATSGSYKVRIPSLSLLLFSRFALSAANLFPLPPVYSGYRDLSVKSEAITISLPPTSASISLAKHDESTVVIVQSTVVTVAAPVPTGNKQETSHGLKRIAAPFLVLITCFISATLYSARFWREEDEKRDPGKDESEKEWLDGRKYDGSVSQGWETKKGY